MKSFWIAEERTNDCIICTIKWLFLQLMNSKLNQGLGLRSLFSQDMYTAVGKHWLKPVIYVWLFVYNYKDENYRKPWHKENLIIRKLEWSFENLKKITLSSVVLGF